MSRRYRPYVPAAGWGDDIDTVAAAVIELQSKRHAAGDDPMEQPLTSDAEAAIETAKSVVHRLSDLRSEQREAFLYLALFPPR